MSVQWGFLKFRGNAEKCYQEIQSLGEEVTPEMIVNYARDDSTELHKCFQWDDSIAAENWRKQQARNVVLSLTVTVETKSHGAQQFRVMQNVDRVYMPVTMIYRDQDQYARLLQEAKAQLAQFRKRYKALTELHEVIEEIDKLLG